MGTGASFAGDCTGDSASKIVVGDGTKVGKGCHFVDQVTFGKKNQITGASYFTRLTTGDDVKIGSDSNITGTVREKATIGRNCHTGVDSIVGVGSTMGDGSSLGAGSTLMGGKKLGAGSCVAYGIRVKIDVPARSMMNIEGKFMALGKGKTASLVSGACVEN